MSDATEPAIEVEDQEKQRRDFGKQLFVAMLRRLALQARVPALARERGWPEDEDLYAALACTVALFALNNNDAEIERPRCADFFGDKWPENETRCSVIYEALKLAPLLEEPDAVQNPG
jgi:hypothetical protein